MSRNVSPEICAELQDRIDQIAGGSAKQRPRLPFGVDDIDEHRRLQ